jgi:ABC-type multidrug transport system fused ATPase/permease subunit
MKRTSLRPELWLPWLTVLGFGSYVVSWFGREAFYLAFGVTSEIVGVDYPTLLVPAAVAGAIMVLLLMAIAALILPLFKRWPRRAAFSQMWVGGLILLATVAVATVIAALYPPFPKKWGPLHLIYVPGWFGILLFAHGGSALTDTRVRRRRMRALRRKLPPEEAMIAYVAERRQRRQGRQARRAKRARITGDVLPAALPLLLSMVILLFIAFAAYLINAAEHAAHNVIANKTRAFTRADLPASVLLNVQARSVRVVAIAPQFRPLESTRLLYLGASDGTYVLYDRTARQAVLVPSGSVALRLE